MKYELEYKTESDRNYVIYSFDKLNKYYKLNHLIRREHYDKNIEKKKKYKDTNDVNLH